ncbi:MAG: GNAT family N-acetyltransferase [Steroidobacteraceae bacterium]
MIDPRPITLEAHGVRLEPLERAHSAALQAAAADGDLWKIWYVSTADLAPGKDFVFVDTALKGLRDGQMLPWIVRELGTGAIVGSTRYHDIVPEIDRVEIGYTFYAKTWQRTHVNTACKLLLLAHAFDTLGCKVVGLRVDNLNEKSQRSVESLGAYRDGIIRHFQVRRDGSPRDTYMYSILATEWPRVKQRLQARLRRYEV